MQTSDLAEIRTLCEQNGALLVADPSSVSPFNVNPLPVCDVLVNSLTKYTGNEGDVMLGCLVFSPSSGADDLSEIRSRTESRLESPYEGDLNRLAWQMPAWEQVVQRSNRSCMELVAFLEGRPEVRKVHWTYADEFRASYESIALGPDSPGCLFSVELTVPLASFYDQLQLLKSPSFGTKFSMACPYLYLAHYDLVSTEKGRATLRKAGLEPDLLRVSVGTEETDRLIEVFAEAFRLAGRD
jgi:cystathionine gamma-synthase